MLVYVTKLLLNGWTDLDDIFCVGSSGIENGLDSKFGPISQLVKNAPKLCKGAQLFIKKSWAIFLSSKLPGEVVLLPLILMILLDSPTQFPIRLAFAITMKKSQGQTMTIRVA
ncbi:hypothetical protein TNCV_2325841 [Trichonephila clavipes]|nr:hypothetical protein TNCV_2325841 [Trichonephila clavipes]